MGHGIFNSPISALPIAVIDLETTGLSPKNDRVVEVSIVRIDPGGPPRLVLDTLVNPSRRVTATHIHRITDSDVEDAPAFSDIAEQVLRVTSGCVLTAYNAYFDTRFLEAEMDRVRRATSWPFLCLMYTGLLVGLPGRTSLRKACELFGISYQQGHEAANDALAAAGLWMRYTTALPEVGVNTFGDLSCRCSYRFLDSFSLSPPSVDGSSDKAIHLKPRQHRGMFATGNTTPSESTPEQRKEYWDVLKAVLSDLRITDQDIESLQLVQSEIGLAAEEIRSLHARAFSEAIKNYIDDGWLDGMEWEQLNRLHLCLHTLGWAPGDAPSPASLQPRNPSAVPIDFTNMKVVLTGTLEHFSRSGLTNLLGSLNARVTGSVSSKTDLVIAGEKAGSKLKKARDLGIEVWDESQLIAALPAEDQP